MTNTHSEQPQDREAVISAIEDEIKGVKEALVKTMDRLKGLEDLVAQLKGIEPAEPLEPVGQEEPDDLATGRDATKTNIRTVTDTRTHETTKKSGMTEDEAIAWFNKHRSEQSVRKERDWYQFGSMLVDIPDGERPDTGFVVLNPGGEIGRGADSFFEFQFDDGTPLSKALLDALQIGQAGFSDTGASLLNNWTLVKPGKKLHDNKWWEGAIEKGRLKLDSKQSALLRERVEEMNAFTEDLMRYYIAMVSGDDSSDELKNQIVKKYPYFDSITDDRSFVEIYRGPNNTSLILPQHELKKLGGFAERYFETDKSNLGRDLKDLEIVRPATMIPSFERIKERGGLAIDVLHVHKGEIVNGNYEDSANSTLF